MHAKNEKYQPISYARFFLYGGAQDSQVKIYTKPIAGSADYRADLDWSL